MVVETITAVELGGSVMIALATATPRTIDPGQTTAIGPTEEKPIVANGVITEKEADRAAMAEMTVACVIEAGETEGGEKGPGLAAGHLVDEEAETVIPKGDGVIVEVAAAVGAAVEVTVVVVAAAGALTANGTTILLVPLGKTKRRRLLEAEEKNTTKKSEVPMRQPQTSRAKIGSVAIAEAEDERRKKARGDRREAAVEAEADLLVPAVVSERGPSCEKLLQGHASQCFWEYTVLECAVASS